MAFFSDTGASTVSRTPGAKFTAKATSQVLLTENKDRVAIYLSNPSAKEVWVNLGGTAVKEEGIWLKKESVLPFPIIGYLGPVSVITTAEEGSIVVCEV